MVGEEGMATAVRLEAPGRTNFDPLESYTCPEGRLPKVYLLQPEQLSVFFYLPLQLQAT